MIIPVEKNKEIKGVIGMTISFGCAIITVLIEAGEIYAILAGLGGLLAGTATAYYYYQKALLIRDVRRRTKTEVDEKKQENL
jgi:hypothetical protein